MRKNRPLSDAEGWTYVCLASLILFCAIGGFGLQAIAFAIVFHAVWVQE